MSDRASWVGEPAAIYCRISHVLDNDQTGVDRQERICRVIAERLGLSVSPEHVFVDNNRSAWKRKRKRQGWDAMLGAMRGAAFRHVIAYHPDRLMRQPKDLEELLQISDDTHVTLHGQANELDLSDADDRFILRIQVAQACKSSDDTSRRIKAAMEDQARDGRPHPGRRRYGYEKDGATIVPGEAEVIRWIYAQYLSGQGAAAIAGELNRRGVATAEDKGWRPITVRSLLTNPHVAGLRVFRGEIVGPGTWDAIIDEGTFREVRERMAFRGAAHRAKYPTTRFYLLRGLVTCGRCGLVMAGNKNSGTPYYTCRHARRKGERFCGRGINAVKLEAFVADAAVEVLTRLDVHGRLVVPVLSARTQADVADDQKRLEELKGLWLDKTITTREYQGMRREVEARMKKAQRLPAVRPVKVLEGLTGPNAPQAWAALDASGDRERMNAVMRFLFSAVVIGESTTPVGEFDYSDSRIRIEPNKL